VQAGHLRSDVRTCRRESRCVEVMELATTLADMCDDIARADSLESEERAEVYTILEIIRTETARHRKVFGRYVSDGGTGDA